MPGYLAAELAAADGVPRRHGPDEELVVPASVRVGSADETTPHPPMVRRVRGCARHAATLPEYRPVVSAEGLRYSCPGPDLIRSPFRVFGAALVEKAASSTLAVDEETVDVCERSYFTFSCGVGALGVDDVRILHRPRESMNRSNSSLWNLTARPGPAGLRCPSRTALHNVTGLTFVYRAA